MVNRFFGCDFCGFFAKNPEKSRVFRLTSRKKRALFGPSLAKSAYFLDIALLALAAPALTKLYIFSAVSRTLSSPGNSGIPTWVTI